MLQSLLEGPYALLIKVGAGLVVVAALFGGGYYEGSKHEKIVVQSKVVDHVITQTQYVTRTEQPKEAKTVYLTQVIHDQAVAQIPEVVPVNPSCDFGPDAISLLNTLRGPLPPQP